MQRKPEESFADYKARRTAENKQLKRELSGRLVWDSAKRGTYIKAKHGELS